MVETAAVAVAAVAAVVPCVVASGTSAMIVGWGRAVVASGTSAMIVGWGGDVVRTTSCQTILVTSAIVGIVRAMWWFGAGGKIGRGAR